MASAQGRKVKRHPGHKSGSSQEAQSAHQTHVPDPFDAAFAQQRPFGDSDYLHEQLHVRYKSRLEKIAEALPVASELSRAMDRATPYGRYRILGDPVVRRTVHLALHHVCNSVQDAALLAACEEVFRETLAHMERGHQSGPLEYTGTELRRLGAERSPSIWSEERGDDLFGRSFRKIVHDNFSGEALCTPSGADLAKLAKGAQLLSALLPLSAGSVLSHTHMVVIVPHAGIWKQKASCSEFDISGTIFLNRDMLGNPWWVAEHLLHESLHQKLYDFRHTHSLMTEDLSPDVAPKDGAAAVVSIWNVAGATRSNEWDTFRSVAAFHVYVHLAVLCAQAERRKTELAKRFGTPEASFPAMTHRREAFERAQYLGRHIQASCWRELGLAGRRFVEWLMSVMNALDPAPPPPESVYLHLLLHRYMVEATLIASRKLSPELAKQLLQLLDEEAQTIGRVLLAIRAAGPDVDRLRDVILRGPDKGPEAAFLRFRSVVTRILQSLSPDGYGLRRASAADSMAPFEMMIRAMVDRSSQQLIPVLSGH